MNFDNNAWLTLYQENFERKRYLYHFTSIEKATLILDGDSLKFSKITSTNDTLEAKPKMSYYDISSNKKLNDIFNCTSNINKKYIQLLCFSMDIDKIKTSDNEKIYLSDYSDRGFALPRMWAQYAHDNDGVCFVFDKEKLSKAINESLNKSLITEGAIEYVSQYTNLNFDYDKLNFLLNSESELVKCINFVDFLKSNKEYTKYNYFYKLKDWANENEYRFLAYGDNDFYIKNIKETIVGIIIGERIKPSDEKIIKFFCKDVCEIKKISFSYSGCLITNIY
jgi:hypothetical protein